MKHVTPLNPSYVVQRLRTAEGHVVMEFYAVSDDGPGMWVVDPYRAVLFESLTSASLVSRSEGAEVRALAHDDDWKEFRK